jgi:zinc/manganese transport system substrate-binding protein
LQLTLPRIIFRRVKNAILSWLACMFGTILAEASPLQVSALHPLLADVARQVGGERVRVFDLVGEGGNLHRFEPQPSEMKKMQESAIVLASGKNMEPYLDRLKSALGGVTLIEVGRTIPSLRVSKDALDTSCPTHGAHATPEAGSLDPHWWHSVDNMRRAARVVAQAFAEKDPAGNAYFMSNASAYGQRLEALQRWANGELSKVPRGQRKLVTAHNAFGYFAKEFGFEVIAVAGLNKEQNTTPQEQAQTIAAIKQSGVRAVFPETNTSGKLLDSIAAATGARLGTPLIADGNGRGQQAGFEAMIRHNVNAITQALTAP